MKVNIKTLVLFATALSLVWMGFLAVGSMIVVYTSICTTMESLWALLRWWGWTDLLFFLGGIIAFIVGASLLIYLYFHGDKFDKSTKVL